MGAQEGVGGGRCTASGRLDGQASQDEPEQTAQLHSSDTHAACLEHFTTAATHEQPQAAHLCGGGESKGHSQADENHGRGQPDLAGARPGRILS